MLLPTMNDTEIAVQIKQEHEKILATTLRRLKKEYGEERAKLKIDKTRTYTRDYAIKTKGKNNWIIFIEKAPSMETFDPRHINFCCVVYYYGLKGIKVFNVSPEDLLVMYNGHFFVRYNERLNLNIPHMIDIVKHFYRHNGYVQITDINKENKTSLIGVAKHGFLLGEIVYNETWIVWRTFISRDLLHPKQNKQEIKILNELKDDIQQILKMEEIDMEDYTGQLDKMLAINGLRKE